MTEYAVPIPEVVEKGRELAEAVGVAGSLEIRDDGELSAAVDHAALLRAALEEAESARDFLVRPLNEHVAAINARFRPRTDAIGRALKGLKGAIAEYHAKRTRAEQEAARAAAEFLGMGEEAREIVGQREDKAVARTAVAAATTQVRWDYEVTDLKALCAGILDGDMPIGLIQPSRGEMRRWLNGMPKPARADELTTHGVRVFKVKDVRLS